MALKTFQGNIASIGVRQLGEILGICRMSVQRAIKELLETGDLKARETGNGQRAWYELTSPVFAQKQRSGVEEVQTYGPLSAPRKRLVSARTA